MSIRSGLATQFGFAQETTWGTVQTPDHFLEFTTESLKNTIDRIESKGLRANNRTLRTDRWAAGKIGIAGDVEFDVMDQGFALLAKNCLGSSVKTTDGAGFKYANTPGDPYGLGMTLQVGRPDVGGVIQPFTYTGCKVTSWELSNSVDNFLHLKVTYDGQNEGTATSLAAASYPATQHLLDFTEGVITIAGQSYNITDWTLTANMGPKPDRYFVGAQTKQEQIINAWATYAISFTLELPSLVPYQLYTAGTLATIVLTYTGHTTYDTAKPYKQVITLQNVRFDGETPNISSPDITMLTLPGVVLNDGTNPVVEWDIYTSESAL